MLPKKKRLRAAEVRGALRGRRYSSEYFTAVMNPAAREGRAVVVSRKVSPSAVTRHRIRRRAYAALENLAAPGAVAIFPKAAVATIPFDALARDLAGLLSKMRRNP